MNRGLLLLVVGVAVTLAVLALVPLFGLWLEARKRKLAVFHAQLRRPPPTAIDCLLTPMLALAVLAVFWAGGKLILGVTFGGVTWFALEVLSPWLVKRRRSAFEMQLPDALEGVANGLEASLVLPDAVSHAGRSSRVPTSEEFSAIMQEYRLGRPLEEAFGDAAARLESRNMELAARAFRVAVHQGGDLGTAFREIADTIREIWRVEEQIRVTTSSARSSARWMSFAPLFFLLALLVMDPPGVVLLFSEPIGLVVLSVVFLINVGCHLWIRSIVDADI